MKQVDATTVALLYVTLLNTTTFEQQLKEEPQDLTTVLNLSIYLISRSNSRSIQLIKQLLSKFLQKQADKSN